MRHLILMAVMVVAVLSVSANADVEIPNVLCSVSIGDGEPVVWHPINGIPAPDDVFEFHGQRADAAGWEVTWDLYIKPDPYVDAGITVKNTTTTTQTFTFTVSSTVSHLSHLSRACALIRSSRAWALIQSSRAWASIRSSQVWALIRSSRAWALIRSSRAWAFNSWTSLERDGRVWRFIGANGF